MAESFSAGSPPLKGLDVPGRRGSMLLEQGLSIWEDTIKMKGALLRLMLKDTPPDVAKVIQSGPLQHAGRLRDALMKAGNPKNNIDDMLDFFVTEEQEAAERREVNRLVNLAHPGMLPSNRRTFLTDFDNYYLPQMISWMRESRRIFSLDRKSIDSFRNASYDDLTFSKILRPFKSFKIEFADSPISVRNPDGKEFRVDGVMVTDISSLDPAAEENLQLRMYLSDPNLPVGISPPFSAADREVIDAFSPENFSKNQGDNDKVQKLRSLAQRGFDMGSFIANYGQTAQIDLDAPIEDPRSDIETNELRKIIAGLCLYLAHNPGVTVENVGQSDIRGETWKTTAAKQKNKKLTVGNLIMNNMQIFSVNKIHEFDPQRGKIVYEDRLQAGVLREAETVRAHERRAPGTGHIKDAPRPIKIASYWRNLKNLPFSALPPGSATVIK